MNKAKEIKKLRRREVLLFVVLALTVLVVLVAGVYLAATLLPASISIPITLSVMLMYEFIVACLAIEKFKY